MKYHPDRNKAPDAEARFKEIAAAYAVLSDPKKRSEYDNRGFAGVADISDQDLFGGINFDDIFGGLNFDLGGSRPFDGLFGRHGQRKAPAIQRGGDIEASLTVSLDRVAQGGEETIRLSYPGTCPACHGTGGKEGAAPRTCAACQGSGRVTQSQRADAQQVLIRRISTCPTCQGRGSIIDNPCVPCRGKGQVEQERSLTLKIPRGVEEGMVLRLPGKGLPSPDAGGSAGDLLVAVHARHDPRFERRGADLHRYETISVTEAVLGARLKVPTLGGSASVTVPPGTQPGAVLRLKGKGLPAYGSDRQGEMYLHILVQIPEKLSSEARTLYERLRDLGK